MVINYMYHGGIASAMSACAVTEAVCSRITPVDSRAIVSESKPDVSIGVDSNTAPSSAVKRELFGLPEDIQDWYDQYMANRKED